MTANEIIKKFLQDVKVDLHQHFDRNFERKAFFNEKWRTNHLPNRRGSPMMRTGTLRRSINSKVQGMNVVFTSSVPYADIHNSGGEIIVTEKMKKFFWAMYYKNAGAVTFNIRKKAMSNTERNRRLSAEAEKWKALALQPTGKIMKIEKQQFIGDHPVARGVIKRSFYRNADEFKKLIIEMAKPKR